MVVPPVLPIPYSSLSSPIFPALSELLDKTTVYKMVVVSRADSDILIDNCQTILWGHSAFSYNSSNNLECIRSGYSYIRCYYYHKHSFHFLLMILLIVTIISLCFDCVSWIFDFNKCLIIIISFSCKWNIHYKACFFLHISKRIWQVTII